MKISIDNVCSEISKLIIKSTKAIQKLKNKIFQKYNKKIEWTLLYKKYTSEYYKILRVNKSMPSLTSVMGNDNVIKNSHVEVAKEAQKAYQEIYREPKFEKSELDWKNPILYEDVIKDEENEKKNYVSAYRF